jgi:hypothetical protein
MGNKILIGMTAAVTAAVIGAPAQAQTPAPAPSVHVAPCHVAQSHNGKGYAWASCSVVGNVPYGQAITVQYNLNLKTFTPPTYGKWAKQTGKFTLANNGGLPGQAPGTYRQMIGAMKFAIQGKTVAQVKKSLKITISAPAGVTVSQAVATAGQSS